MNRVIGDGVTSRPGMDRRVFLWGVAGELASERVVHLGIVTPRFAEAVPGNPRSLWAQTWFAFADVLTVRILRHFDKRILDLPRASVACQREDESTAAWVENVACASKDQHHDTLESLDDNLAFRDEWFARIAKLRKLRG